MNKIMSLLMIGLLMLCIVAMSECVRKEAESTTGAITGILVNKESGEPISDIFVFLGVPLSEIRLLIQIYGNKKWEPLVGVSGEQLWTRITNYIDEFDGKEVIYMLPYFPCADSDFLICERFKVQPDQKGAFTFTDVHPGAYYILAGDSPLEALPQLGKPLPRSYPRLFPARASGVVDSSGYIVIQGVVVAYVTTGSVQGGLFNVQADQTLNAGVVQYTPWVTLRTLLGHDRLTTTEIYVNLSPEDAIREFLNKW